MVDELCQEEVYGTGFVGWEGMGVRERAGEGRGREREDRRIGFGMDGRAPFQSRGRCVPIVASTI